MLGHLLRAGSVLALYMKSIFGLSHPLCWSGGAALMNDCSPGG